jgi:hypothetical protein
MKEVKSYLELSQLARNAFCRHPSLTEKERKYLAWFQEFIGGEDKDMMAFYSQKFTPELITKYFEGWEYNNDTNIYHAESNELISLDYFNKTYIYRGRHWYPPTTLDRFICHCQDAGIKLYFKEVKK